MISDIHVFHLTLEHVKPFQTRILHFDVSPRRTAIAVRTAVSFLISVGDLGTGFWMKGLFVVDDAKHLADNVFKSLATHSSFLLSYPLL